MTCVVGSATVRLSGCPVSLQRHTRDGADEMRDRLPCCDMSDIFLKLSKQFQSPS